MKLPQQLRNHATRPTKSYSRASSNTPDLCPRAKRGRKQSRPPFVQRTSTLFALEKFSPVRRVVGEIPIAIGNRHRRLRPDRTTDSESVAFFRVWNLHAVNRRVVGSKSHRRSQPSVGAKTTRFSCAVPRSVCDPLTRTTMYQYQFTVPAVLSKLLHLRFGGDSIPTSRTRITCQRGGIA